MDDRLVPIGRFAEMTRLSVKTLRHYHDVGLMEPAVVAEQTGYRYYRLGQANRAEAIRALREVDMPLEEIATVLDSSDDPRQVQERLHAHRRRLADELRRYEGMLDFLERLLVGQQPLMPYDIELESVPDRRVASTRMHTDLDTMPSDLADAFQRIVQVIDGAGRQPSGRPLVVFHDIIDVDEPGEIAVAIPIDGEGSAPVGNVTFTELVGGQAAVTTHRGPYSQIAPAYHAITDWMVARGYEADGPPREIYLSDPSAVDEADLLTRVEWPVR